MVFASTQLERGRELRPAETGGVEVESLNALGHKNGSTVLFPANMDMPGNGVSNSPSPSMDDCNSIL